MHMFSKICFNLVFNNLWKSWPSRHLGLIFWENKGYHCHQEIASQLNWLLTKSIKSNNQIFNPIWAWESISRMIYGCQIWEKEAYRSWWCQSFSWGTVFKRFFINFWDWCEERCLSWKERDWWTRNKARDEGQFFCDLTLFGSRCARHKHSKEDIEKSRASSFKCRVRREIHSFIKTHCSMYKFWLTLHHPSCLMHSRKCMSWMQSHYCGRVRGPHYSNWEKTGTTTTTGHHEADAKMNGRHTKKNLFPDAFLLSFHAKTMSNQKSFGWNHSPLIFQFETKKVQRLSESFELLRQW